MDYAVSLLICAVELFLLWFYFKKIDLFARKEAEDEKKAASKQNNLQLYLTLGVIAIMMIVTCVLTLKDVSNYLNFLKLILLLGVVAAAGAVDLKKTIIPNLLILIGLGARIIIYIAELAFYNEIFIPQLKSDALGFAFGFGFLLIVTMISKGALGFGDVKLFGVIGLMSGAICTYYTLLFSLLSSVLVSLILLIMKKKGRKDSIPFGPCILIGYFAAIVLACY